jgi:drug/metabolite transporter (DMT)-like permease
MTSSHSHRFRADAALLLTTVIWGANITVVKSAVGAIDPITFNSLRMVLSTVTIGLLAWAESQWSPSPSAPWSLRRGLCFALLSGLAYPLLFMFGIDRTTAGNTALLLASMPIWTAFISFIFLHERLSRITWLGLLVSLVGTLVVIVAGGKVSTAKEFYIGNVLVLAAAICWASATVTSGPLLRAITPLRLTFYASMLTTPIHLMIAAHDIPHALQQLHRPGLMMAIVYSGTLSTGLAYATWHYGVRQLGGSHASVFQNVVTLVAVVSAWIFLQEPITEIQMVGGLVLFAGLYFMRKGRQLSLANSQRNANPGD